MKEITMFADPPNDGIGKHILKAVLVASISAMTIQFITWGIEELKMLAGRHSALKKPEEKKEDVKKDNEATKEGKNNGIAS
jgi:hypothetical protein